MTAPTIRRLLTRADLIFFGLVILTPTAILKLPPTRLPGRIAEKTDGFRMRRKPGVERNDQISHFGDMPTNRTRSALFNDCALNGKVAKTLSRRLADLTV